MEVYEHQVQETMYSEIVNSKLAFCAKRWVGTLLQMFKRNDSKFFNVKMPLGWRGMLLYNPSRDAIFGYIMP